MKNSKTKIATSILTMLSAITISHGVLAADLTRDNGSPVGDNQNSQTAGPAGPVLLQDSHLIEKLQRFDRERIPERVVHARGTGIFGEFEPTSDISALTTAKVFTPGTKTPVFVRFSTVMGYRGSPEQARDPRGFAIKFYTEQGNWDIVGINEPVFFIRDAIKFPDFVHANKPSAVTGVQDPNLAFDFFAHTPESTHMLTMLYSALGMPDSYRHMDGFGVHAFKFVNAKGEVHYVKFHWKSSQGLHSILGKDVPKSIGTDWNMMSNDLYDAVKAKDYPKWDMYVQVLSPKDFDKFDFDPLDDTKVWPVAEQKVGTMTLNRIPDNYFDSTEQSAFAPSRLVPGIEPSEDRMLQGRLFSYADTQMYRLGANFSQLPINRALVPVNNNNQDGMMNGGNRKGDVNYEPTSTSSELTQPAQYKYVQTPLKGTTQQRATYKTMNFRQAGEYYRSLSEMDKNELVSNLSGDLNHVTNEVNKYTMLSYFYKADADYGKRLVSATHADLARVQGAAARLNDN